MAARKARLQRGLEGRYPEPLERLISLLMRLPGVGLRAGERMALYLLEASNEERKALADAVLSLEKEVRFCRLCGGLTDRDLCRVCSNPKRDKSVVCVVEWPHEVGRIEESGAFNGVFHVLMGHLDPDGGVGPDRLRFKELLARVEKDAVKEAILALNPTIAGDATADYLAGLLKGKGVKITRLARGVPFGGELEYLRPESLRHALLRREELP